MVIDDEPLVLDAIRRQFRSKQKDWDAHFFLKGEDALAFMVEHPTDVVLTDLNMAPLDGEAVLRAVQERSPGTVRLMLSGAAGLKTALPAALLAHQSFSKPCDPLELRLAIERAFRARSASGTHRMQALVGSLESLPSVPETYTRLTRVMNDPDAGLNEVAEIIEEDAAISTKLIQLVNSSMFAVAQRVDSVRDAASYLGMNLVRMLVLSAEVHERFSPAAMQPGFSLEREQAHGSLVANIAREMTDDRELSDRFFLAGLLHDVGRVVLASVGVSDDELGVEGPVLHASVGAHLLTLWGIPLSVVDAVGHHHDPAAAEPGEFGVVTAIHVADVLAHELSTEGRGGAKEMDEDHLRRLGVIGRVEEWREAARQLVGSGGAEAA
ncbi:MAG: HDOD domain-containing protein [Planctomycetota bacterium]|nr:HDOD domain-containing protein [Planctomycetota bacterium]